MDDLIEAKSLAPEDHPRDPVEVFLSSFRSPQTRTAYKYDLDQFLNFIDTLNVSPGQVKPLHVTEFLNSIHGTMAPKTFNRRLSTIKSFYKWAKRNNFINHNPADAIKYEPATPVAPTTALSDSEARKMMNAPRLNTVVGASDRLAMVLLFHLGLRRAELVSLKWSDISEDRNTKVIEIMGKGRKTRRIPLTEKVLEELTRFKDIYYKLTKTRLGGEYPIIQRFRTPTEKTAHPSTILKMMKKYAKILKIDKSVGTHSCRATVISQLLENGESVRNVQAFAGHASPYTTMLYDKKRDGLKNSSAFKVDFENENEDIPIEKKN